MHCEGAARAQQVSFGIYWSSTSKGRRRRNAQTKEGTMHPRHRGGCADFYYAPHQDERVDLKVPVDVRGELELAAARAGLTWNDQLCYVGELFLGLRPPDFD